MAIFDYTAHDKNAVGILVGFDGPDTSTPYFGVRFYPEDKPGCAVYLVADKALCPFIERDAINVLCVGAGIEFLFERHDSLCRKSARLYR
ncbi:MAG: hypothetical protein PHO08_11990 [Methylococcales bacterium]|nr:hypothetical protein [Methylococcales bacterium]MDD5632182.1 hypothetical protein [Methylococcales bacterium]